MKKFNVTDYNREKYRAYLVRVDRAKDPDVIERMESMDNLSAYVRGLVRADINEDSAHGEKEKHV